MKVHCLFEQSGTFKNEFKKLGYEAFDYDILNDFGQTDFKVDLFDEIRKAYQEEESIFDNFKNDDLILAFFPCTRFETQVTLLFRGEANQQKKWTDIQKLEYDMKLHDELHELYELLCMMSVVVIRKDLKMIIENPCTPPHYLTTYWCMKPSLVDKNRRDDGDYYKKPTQYWFINCKVQQNLVFEPIEVVKQKTIKNPKHDGGDRKVVRSLIHPQYARRFIKQYILEEKQND